MTSPTAARGSVGPWQGQEFATVESVKAVSHVYAPVGGTVTEANHDVLDKLDLINSSPEGDGWFVKMSISDPAELDHLLKAARFCCCSIIPVVHCAVATIAGSLARCSCNPVERVVRV
jgi:hypothetical protein